MKFETDIASKELLHSTFTMQSHTEQIKNYHHVGGVHLTMEFTLVISKTICVTQIFHSLYTPNGPW